ncbi:hypothetical protein [Deinococcus frigens]
MKTPFLVAALALSATSALAQGADTIKPPPSSIGSNISQEYQGPTPSSFQKELVGPLLLRGQARSAPTARA